MSVAAEPAPTRLQTLPPWALRLVGQAIALGLALAFAALVGSIIIVLYGADPLIVFETIIAFSTNRPQDFGYVLENATPLIFSGLAVAVAFKAGMFNIGVEGQYIVGMAAGAAVATGMTLPAPIHLPLVAIAAMLGAMVWAAIPAVLKVKTGAHEVVTTIMMNGIAISLVAWALLNPLRSGQQGLIDLRTDLFPQSALVPSLARSFGIENLIPEVVHLTWLFPLAILACLATWFLLYRTRLGYEVRAVGSSAGSAEAGGVNIGAAQIKIFLVSGALAGLVGLNHMLGDTGYLGANYEAGLGFAGIAVAFLGRNHPAGIPLAAILLGMLTRGQDGIAVVTDLPLEILIILQGVLILSVVVAYEIANRIIRRYLQEQERAVESAPEAA